MTCEQVASELEALVLRYGALRAEAEDEVEKAWYQGKVTGLEIGLSLVRKVIDGTGGRPKED